MATLHKFSAAVCTTLVDGSPEGWIDESQLPDSVRDMLRAEFSGQGSAWLIRLDRWFTPVGKAGETLHMETRHLALNDATMPCIVSGDVDYSAWDD